MLLREPSVVAALATVQAAVKLLGVIAEVCWLWILVLVCFMMWAAGAVVKL